MVRRLDRLWLFSRSGRRDRLLLTVPFYLLFLVQLIHHRIWRDEINAWTISSISHNIPELLHGIHYDAHPALWYVLLHAASRFSHRIWMLKLVEAAIGTGTYFLLAWNAPLRRLELLLVLCSYYLFFEYTVLLRMYGLELLFALAYAHLRTRHPGSVLRNTLLLGLLANVDITGAILAGGLLLEYQLVLLTDRSTAFASRVRCSLLSVGLFLAMFAVALQTLWPAKDIGWSTTGRLFSQFWDGDHAYQGALKWIAVAWIPKPINVLSEWMLSEFWPYAVMVPVILLLLYLTFRNHWRQGAGIVAVIAAGILFSQITNVAGVRHTGIVYIATVAMLWLLRAGSAPISWCSYLLLFLPVVPGFFAEADQWSRPYADGQAAAAWIQRQHLENLPLFGTSDTSVLTVPELLQRPFYQLECNCSDDTLVFSSRRDVAHDDQGYIADMPERLIRGFRTGHVTTGLFLDSNRMRSNELRRLLAAGFDPVLIASFDCGFLSEEHYYIYRVTAPPAPM